jgi:aryl-alcohol dehydrogenase-like predicted oxidoreductase
MHYQRLGPRGPKVSTIGFGAWAIGGKNWGPTDDNVSRAALRAALDAGVTFIDTADVYGFGPIRQTYTKDYLIAAAERSLVRLGVDCLDILQLHSPDVDKLERDEPWAALEQLKRDGKIRHAGWSVQSFKETDQAFLLDRHHGLLDVIQVRYNMLEREAERVLLPAAQRHGIGVIVRIPMLFGLLTGKFTRASRFGEDDHRQMNLAPEKLEGYLARIEKLQPVFQSQPGQTMAQVALRFCLSHPACHTAIPGAKTPAQAAANASAADLGPLPKETIEQIGRLDA